MKNVFFKTTNQRVMETGDHFKNGASSKSQTSRGNFLRNWRTILVIGLIAILSSSCGSKKVPVDSLDFLIGQRELDVVLNFDDVLLQGLPEKTFLRDEQPEWVEKWEKEKTTLFEENFLGHLNNNVRIRCGDYPNAQYQATVFILAVNRKGPGKHLEGPGTREVTCEVVFTKMRNSQPLATLYAKGDSGGGQTYNPTKSNSIRGIMGAAGSNTSLTTRAFGYLGQNLGRDMARKMK